MKPKTEPTQDHTLVETIKQCQSGDPTAWETLVRMYQGRVYAMAFQYLNNHDDASEITQDVFLKVYQQIKQFKGDHFLAWLLFITRNQAIDRLRWLKVRSDTQPKTESDPDFVDPGLRPDQHFEQKHKQSLIYRAMRKLAPQKRELVMMKEVQGLKFKEIASMLGLPVGTVKSRSNQARMELARAVLEIEPEYGEGGST